MGKQGENRALAARGQAVKALIERHRSEFDELMAAEYDRIGLIYVKPMSKAERDEQKRQAVITKAKAEVEAAKERLRIAEGEVAQAPLAALA